MKKNLLVLSLVGCVLALESAHAGWKDYLPSWVSDAGASSRGGSSSASAHRMRPTGEEEWVVTGVNGDVERVATSAQLLQEAHRQNLAEIRQAYLDYQAATRAREENPEQGAAPDMTVHEAPAAAAASPTASAPTASEAHESRDVVASASASTLPSAAAPAEPAEASAEDAEDDAPRHTPKVWTEEERVILRKLREEMAAFSQKVRYEYETPASTKLTAAEQYEQYRAHQAAVHGPATRK